ncbi:MAG TPA: hypothetical protein VNR65_15980 [Geobacterales bacterium]|nr:hypothetical protein [Geobacterales bacterium]
MHPLLHHGEGVQEQHLVRTQDGFTCAINLDHAGATLAQRSHEAVQVADGLRRPQIREDHLNRQVGRDASLASKNPCPHCRQKRAVKPGKLVAKL